MPQDEEAPIPIEEDLEPLSLADDEDPDGAVSGASSTKIHAFGSHADTIKTHGHTFKRPTNLTGAGATRCRLFHSKITAIAMEYMVNTINEWIDGDKIEVKHVGQVVGTMEGKTPEPNVIITIWY